MNQALFPIITHDDLKLPFYVTSIGGRTHQENIIRTEGYPEYHWLHSVKGKGKLIIESKEYIIDENMGFFIPPNIPHEYSAVSSIWSTHWITFKGKDILPLLEIVGLNHWSIFSNPTIHILNNILEDIYQIVISEKPNKGFECSTILYKFFLELKKTNALFGSNKIKKERQLQPILSFIEKNYSLPILLEELSAIIDVTPQHLCRLFKQSLNLSPFEYITTFRIQKAKGLLLEPNNLLLIDICNMVGYSDTSYFCAIFKKYVGMTPIMFREQHTTNFL